MKEIVIGVGSRLRPAHLLVPVCLSYLWPIPRFEPLGSVKTLYIMLM